MDRAIKNSWNAGFPSVLPMRERAAVINEVLRERLDKVLPVAMREANLDMWIILCQEDDLDPIYRTMIPMDCWSPILQMLIFVDEGEQGIARYNVSGTDTKDLYERPYRGQIEEQQWAILLDLVQRRDPQTIGVNIGRVKWASGGLTYNLFEQLRSRLPEKYAQRLVSAEQAAVRWGATLTGTEIELFRHAVKIAQSIIADCFSRSVITPGVTTVQDLVWFYWQRVTDLGLTVSFRPYFSIIRPQKAIEKYGTGDQVIRPGDVLHCDVGIHYLRLNTDNQRVAYVLRQGETEAPQGLRALLAQTNELQDIFMSEFQVGLTGNELLQNILSRARRQGLINPRVYSHSLGLFLHQPGPLIGLPWEQEQALPRGETKLQYNYAFAMELSTEMAIPEWDNQIVRCSLEEPVVFTQEGCRTVSGRQTEFYLI